MSSKKPRTRSQRSVHVLVIVSVTLVVLGLVAVFAVWPVARSMLSAHTADGGEPVSISEANDPVASVTPGEGWDVRRTVESWWQPWKPDGILNIVSPDESLVVTVTVSDTAGDFVTDDEQQAGQGELRTETLASGLTADHFVVDDTLIVIVSGGERDERVFMQATADDLGPYLPALSGLVESVTLAQ
ncbi:MAG: hypothetical protein ACTHZ9_02220 [Leucobacter sp.]